MATVHFGRLLGPVGFARTVAIKRLHPHYTKDPEFVAMFLDEARLAARIRHPNVVPTLDVVALEGELFLVMEYVQGESLSRLLRLASERGSRIRPEFAASIVVSTLHGLHAAHEARSEDGEPLNIVHRDVSPHNILVGTDGVTRVLDFGVAKAAGRIQTTSDGQLKGKLAYMPPEQIRGAVSRVTDVYSSGVVLWEALTGRRLFRGENDAQVFSMVLEMTIEPPSKYVPSISPEVDALTLRALSRDPSERFQTAREMARALEKCLPLVPASDIGEWVEQVAGDSLASRTANIASIEKSSSQSTPTPGSATGPMAVIRSGSIADVSSPASAMGSNVVAGGRAEPPTRPPPTPTAVNTIGEDIPTLSSGSFLMGSSSIPRAKRAPMLPIALTAMAVVGVVSAVLFLRAGHGTTAPTSAAANPAAVAAPINASPSANSMASAEASPSSSPSPMPPSVPTIESSKPGSVASSSPPPKAVPKAAPPSKPKSSLGVVLDSRK